LTSQKRQLDGGLTLADMAMRAGTAHEIVAITATVDHVFILTEIRIAQSSDRSCEIGPANDAL